MKDSSAERCVFGEVEGDACEVVVVRTADLSSPRSWACALAAANRVPKLVSVKLSVRRKPGSAREAFGAPGSVEAWPVEPPVPLTPVVVAPGLPTGCRLQPGLSSLLFPAPRNGPLWEAVCAFLSLGT